MNEIESLRVGVLFGGRSSEHEVSLASARNVIDALQRAGHTVIPIGISPQGRWLTTDAALAQLSDGANSEVDASALRSDRAANHLPVQGAWELLPHAAKNQPLPEIDVVFPVLHGPYGEDGTVQGLLEMASLPYVGCGVAASAVGMDKALTKQLFAAAGLPQTAFQVVMRRAWRQDAEAVIAQLEAELEYPLFVKPANLGSSVGISKVHHRAELGPALDLAARFDRKLIVEAGVPNAREIEVSVLGNDTPLASVPGEIVPGGEFYDYAAKYIHDTSKLLIPAPLDDACAARIRAMAVAAFRTIDGSGLARVDFLLDDESGAVYLNEINTMPGFTRISMYPKLWEASGLSYAELVDSLVRLALRRFEDRQQNVTTREF